MAFMKQDIPNRVTVYHDNVDQEQELVAREATLF